MAHLRDVCDPALVDEAIGAGLVSVHADGPLRILNYTAKATYSRHWNEATVACRGLILDDADRVVARPFPKFFGPSEPDAPAIPTGRQMEVTAKLDGSLGIAYTHPEGDVRLATRGSLVSRQAIEATRIWREKYRHVAIPEGVTPLFEIIYPDNRIVLDYGEMRDLVLLALIDTETGADIDPADLAWPGPRAETMSLTDFGALLDHISSDSGSDCEGYVARFATDEARPHTRFKVKFPAYVAAHRIVFGLTSTRVWEAAAVSAAARMGVPAKATAARLRLSPETIAGLLGQGEDPVEGLRSTLPEEFLPWYDSAVAEVTAKANERIRLYGVTGPRGGHGRRLRSRLRRRRTATRRGQRRAPRPDLRSAQGARRRAPSHLGPDEAERTRRPCDSLCSAVHRLTDHREGCRHYCVLRLRPACARASPALAVQLHAHGMAPRQAVAPARRGRFNSWLRVHNGSSFGDGLPVRHGMAVTRLALWRWGARVLPGAEG